MEYSYKNRDVILYTDLKSAQNLTFDKQNQKICVSKACNLYFFVLCIKRVNELRFGVLYLFSRAPIYRERTQNLD